MVPPPGRSLPGHVRHLGRRAGDAVARRSREASAAAARSTEDLYAKALDRAFTSPYEVTSYAEALRLLGSGKSQERDLVNQAQRVAALLLPIIRRTRFVARVPGLRRVPWIWSAVAAADLTKLLVDSMRDLRVLVSFLEYRFEVATGRSADPDLLKKVAVALYVDPDRPLQLADRTVRVRRVPRRLLVHALTGRSTEKRAKAAVKAADRLDPLAVTATWQALPRQEPAR